MSESKSEMVTIEVPIGVASRVGGAHIPMRADTDGWAIRDACKAALDARKSKYELWREEQGFPWRRVETRVAIADRSAYLESVDLMAAAPQLLDALIAHRDALVSSGAVKVAPGLYAYELIPVMDEAIRAALPEDVADEVLGHE